MNARRHVRVAAHPRELQNPHSSTGFLKRNRPIRPDGTGFASASLQLTAHCCGKSCAREKSARREALPHLGPALTACSGTRSRAADAPPKRAAETSSRNATKKCSARSAAASPAASPTTCRPRRRPTCSAHHQVQNSRRPPTATSPSATGRKPWTVIVEATLIPRWPSSREQRS